MIAALLRWLRPAPAPIAAADVAAGLIPPTKPAVWAGEVPPEAVQLSEAMENCALHPYNDGYGYWTIGIGSRLDPWGKPVTAGTPTITREQAEAMAERDLARAADVVRKAVKVPLTTRQAAALILFANNLGGFSAAPTLIGHVNAGRWRDAAESFKLYRNSAGKPSTGLRRRRWTEASYSLGLDAATARKRAWAEITTVDGWPKLPS